MIIEEYHFQSAPDFGIDRDYTLAFLVV